MVLESELYNNDYIIYGIGRGRGYVFYDIYRISTRTFHKLTLDEEKSEEDVLVFLKSIKDIPINIPPKIVFKKYQGQLKSIVENKLKKVKSIDYSVDLVIYNNKEYAFKRINLPPDVNLIMNEINTMEKIGDLDSVVKIEYIIVNEDGYCLGYIEEFMKITLEKRGYITNDDIITLDKLIKDIHERGIYKFDLKPDNIMYNKEGKLKIIDANQGYSTEGYGETDEYALLVTIFYMTENRIPSEIDIRDWKNKLNSDSNTIDKVNKELIISLLSKYGV